MATPNFVVVLLLLVLSGPLAEVAVAQVTRGVVQSPLGASQQDVNFSRYVLTAYSAGCGPGNAPAGAAWHVWTEHLWERTLPSTNTATFQTSGGPPTPFDPSSGDLTVPKDGVYFLSTQCDNCTVPLVLSHNGVTLSGRSAHFFDVLAEGDVLSVGSGAGFGAGQGCAIFNAMLYFVHDGGSGSP